MSFVDHVRIIAMMRPRTFTPGLVWLAILALAAQGFGAAALLDACRCTNCECGPQDQENSCCAGRAAQEAATNCGPSCCRTSLSDCAQSVTTTGSCCCQATESPAPANLFNGNQAGPDSSLSLHVPSLIGEAAPPLAPSDILHAGFRCPSPPHRILYCVWRI